MKRICSSIVCLLAGLFACMAVEPSGTLPVLVIETENRQPIESKETYIRGNYYLDPKGVEGVEAIGSKDAPLPLQIRGRGNYTWSAFNKKPYRLKLDKKAALLGMNSNKHFALLAHADDNRAFMRNLTGFEVSRMSGLPYTTADQPCEVVLNGDYKGLYFLTETIRFDKKRINLSNPDDDVEDWLAANPGKTADDYPWTDDMMNGPWLVELDNTDDQNQITVPSQYRGGAEGTDIRVTYKKPEDYVTEKHRQWLKQDFSEIDNLVYASDNAKGAWLDKIDLTDAARFFIVNQIMGNYESYHGSCYLTKDRGADQKWHFGPVWDFGSAFQQTRDVTQWIWENTPYNQRWIENFMNCETFKNEVKRIFTAMNTEGFDRIINYQNAYAARITAAAKRDAERWNNDGYGNPDMEKPLKEVQKQLVDAINSFGYKLGIEGFEGVEIGPTADIYLRGHDYNGWDAMDANKFTNVGNDVYELKMKRLSGEFKLADTSWVKINLGCEAGKKFDLNKAYKLITRGENISLASGSADNVTLRLVWKTKELTITNSTGVQLVIDGDLENAEIYTLQGVRVQNPVKGNIYILRTAEGARKVVF